MRYLLDTNICIYALKNRPPEVLNRLRSVGRSAVAVSVITVLELRNGAEKSLAAQALTRDLVLVTHNLREFQRVPELQVESWVDSARG